MAAISEFKSDPNRSIILLAPRAEDVPSSFQRIICDSRLHAQLIGELQRLRGRAYLDDGAIQSWQLTSDGRHASDVDLRSWHTLALDACRQVAACARYHHYEPWISFEDLTVRRAALASSREWGSRFRKAVEEEIARARVADLGYVELGGWAVRPEYRCTQMVLAMALSSYALSQLLGGALGISTATTRHNSARILRRLGGRSLHADGTNLPAYFDPQYGCTMEVLRFDSAEPNERFVQQIMELNACLAATVVVAPENCGDCARYQLRCPPPLPRQLDSLMTRDLV